VASQVAKLRGSTGTAKTRRTGTVTTWWPRKIKTIFIGRDTKEMKRALKFGGLGDGWPDERRLTQTHNGQGTEVNSERRQAEDGLSEIVRRFLWQVMADAACQCPMLVLASESLGIGCGRRMCGAVGVALHGDRRHGDSGRVRQTGFQRIVFAFSVGQAQAPAVVMDNDVDVVRIFERRRAARMVCRGLRRFCVSAHAAITVSAKACRWLPGLPYRHGLWRHRRGDSGRRYEV